MTVPLPEEFGRYRILRTLGQGGMGAVYLAHDTVMAADVALKVPRFGDATTKKAIERFYREARAMFGVRHPNVCPVYDVGEFEGHHYLVMAYVEGQTLGQRLAETGRLDETTAARLVGSICRGMQAVHDKGIIHRDLKPDNIMLERGGVPIVMDAGLALDTLDAERSRLTHQGAIIGTPAYMPFEQAMGEIERIQPATDVYSLGVVLYELVSGRVPFQGGPTAVLGQVIGLEAPPISEWLSEVDPQFETICMRAMAKQPEDRYPTMNEFAQALKHYLATTRALKKTATPDRSSESDWPTHSDSTKRPLPPRPALPRRKKTTDRITSSKVSTQSDSQAKRKPFFQSKSTTSENGIPWGWVAIVIVVTALAIPGFAFLFTDSTPSGTNEPSNSTPQANSAKAPPRLIAPFGQAAADAAQQEWADHFQAKVIETNSVGMPMVFIPPGEFQMGSPEDETGHQQDEQLHRVRITSPFYLSQTEMTQQQWNQLTGQTAGIVGDAQNRPITNIDWYSAIDICNQLSLHENIQPYYQLSNPVWADKEVTYTVFESVQEERVRDVNGKSETYTVTLQVPVTKTRTVKLIGHANVTILGGDGYRLPTEAEWEYACRAGSLSAYHFGDDSSDLPQYAQFKPADDPGSFRIHNPVARKQPNAWRLYDMMGSAMEWCEDRYDASYYASSPLEDPKGHVSRSERTLRGGSYLSDALNCRSANRIALMPDISPAQSTTKTQLNITPDQIGFRVARNLPRESN